jgi:hypothetical protein
VYALRGAEVSGFYDVDGEGECVQLGVVGVGEHGTEFELFYTW